MLPSCINSAITVDGFILVGTDFRGLNKNNTFVGFKIRCQSILFNNSYRNFVGTGIRGSDHEIWYPTKFKPFTVF